MARLRRVVVDVDKPIKEPSLFTLVDALESVTGVLSVNVTVNEMDVDVMGTLITVEGDGFSFAKLEEAINGVGAVIHSVDQIVAGEYAVETPKMRKKL